MKQGKLNIWLLLLIAVATIWGGGFVVVSFALDTGVSSNMLNVLRFSTASAAMFCIYFKKIIKLNLKQVGYGAVTALFMAVGFGTQTAGMQYTSSANAALITGLYVVLIPFFTWIAYKKRPAPKVFIAAVLCFVSISLLSISDVSNINFGDLLCLMCAVAYALHFMVLSVTSKKMDGGALTFLQMFFCAVFFLIYGTIFDRDGFNLSGVSTNLIYCVAYLGLLSTAFAYVVQTKAQTVVSPSYASLILSCESLFGSIFSVLFGLAPLTVFLIIGTIGVTASIFIVEYNPQKLPTPKNPDEIPCETSTETQKDNADVLDK